MCPGGQEIETFAHLHTLSWRTCLQSHEQNPGVETRRAGMKGCFVFPHKEMTKANKGFNFFYGSLCWASPVSMCPAQTDPLEMGIHPWGKKTFQGEGLRLPSLFSLGRGSLGVTLSPVSWWLLDLSFPPCFPSRERAAEREFPTLPAVLGSLCKRAGRGFDPMGIPLPLGTPQMPVQPPEPLPEPWLLLACPEMQGTLLCVGRHQNRRKQSGFVLIEE